MLIVGIDENGFGPRLGPLVVTASLVDIENMDDLLKSSLRESKQICSSGNMGCCEQLALSFYKILYDDIPTMPSGFFPHILLTQEDECSSPLPCCTPNFSLPCWVSIDQLDSEIARGYLEEIYVNLVEIKSIVLCPGKFNGRLNSVSSKNHLVYSLFEELFKYFVEHYPKDELVFLCGRIGSTKDYSSFFGRFSLIPQGEEKEEIWYRLPGGGEVRFITNGDDKYFPITISSIIGKYIRELFIEQMNRFFRAHLPDLPYCSGYRDTKTLKFVEETRYMRKQLSIPDRCFLREK